MKYSKMIDRIREFIKSYGWKILWLLIVLVTAYSTGYALISAMLGHQFNEILAWGGVIILIQNFIIDTIKGINNILDIKLEKLEGERSE